MMGNYCPTCSVNTDKVFTRPPALLTTKLTKYMGTTPPQIGRRDFGSDKCQINFKPTKVYADLNANIASRGLDIQHQGFRGVREQVPRLLSKVCWPWAQLIHFARH